MFDIKLADANKKKAKDDENAKQNKAKKRAQAKEDKAFNDKYIDYDAVEPEKGMFDKLGEWYDEKFGPKKEPWQVGYQGKR